MASKLLTKSRYMAGLQCPRYLWLLLNDPEKIPGPDASTQYVFDQGHLVGELAKKLFPEGINVPFDDFMGNIYRTKQLLEERKPLFEPGFMAGGLYARLDILNPSTGHGWDIIEVKSTTSVKNEHIDDMAFQKICCEKQGLLIVRCFLAHINNQYVKDGELDPFHLFTVEDITDKVKSASTGINNRIVEMQKIIASPQCPDIPIGEHCNSPYGCPVTACWEALPENNIFCLYRGGKKRFDLFNQGILNIRDIPETYKLSQTQNIQKQCDISGKPYTDREQIKRFLSTLQQPLHYLDFETINPALPLFDGTRPFQKIPFQFSMHIRDGNKPVEHVSFLAEGRDDPRPRFLERLRSEVQPTGSIVIYNQVFERDVLRDLAKSFPDYTEWVEQTCERMVDLWKPFQYFHYYNPEQKGSASIKNVLPALTGRSYKEMSIADGEAAGRAFMTITYGDVPEADQKQVRADLEKYCGLDTEGMVLIVEKLHDMVRR